MANFEAQQPESDITRTIRALSTRRMTIYFERLGLQAECGARSGQAGVPPPGAQISP